MDYETLQEIESLLMAARNRTEMVQDGYKDGQAGSKDAYFMHSNVCKALAHLRTLKAMNV